MSATCNSLDGNRCPVTHPWAYDDGLKCCGTPFEDVNDAGGKFYQLESGNKILKSTFQEFNAMAVLYLLTQLAA